MSGLVMLTARTTAMAPMVYNAVARQHPIERVVVEEPASRAAFLRRRVQRLGPVTVAGQVLFQALAVPVLQRRAHGRLREIADEHGLDPTPIPTHVIAPVPSVNDAATRALLLEIAPRGVLVFGTRIIARSILEAVDARFINVHAGITPLYRGVHGGYWALHEQRPEHFGATIHLVDPGIDTGAILGQVRVQPSPRDDFATYPLLQTAAALPLLVDIVGKALRGDLAPCPVPAGASRLWSHPTLVSYLAGRLRGIK